MLIFPLMYIKRLIRNPVFMAALILAPVIALALYFGGGGEADGISVGVCGAFDGYAETVTEELAGHEGLMRFTVYEDDASMLDDIETGELRMGYSLGDGLTEGMLGGRLRHTVTRYAASDDAYAPLVDEVVSAAIYRAYAPAVGEQMLKSGAYTDDADAVARFGELYAEYDSNIGSVFTYETAAGKSVDISASAALFPVKGFLSMTVLLAALAGALTVAGDRRAGIYLRLSPLSRSMAAFSGVAVPCAALCAVCIIWQLATGKELLHELISAIMLFAMCAGLGLTVSCIGGSSGTAMAIPVLMLASIAFAPVFFDVTAFVPFASYIGWFVPSYWYLHSAESAAYIIGGTVYATVMLIPGLLMSRR